MMIAANLARRGNNRPLYRFHTPVLPNFLVIGAMKAGTTSLHKYLRHHPQIFMSRPKEPEFFSNEAHWTRGLGWYEAHFEGAADAQAVGEASTGYSKHPQVPGVPARIASVIPECRFIYVVRDPIDRLRSHYLHSVVKNRESRPIEQAVRDDSRYIDTSRYALQLDRYVQLFSRDQILVITAEDLKAGRDETLRRVYAFLGVADDFRMEAGEEFNVTSGKRIHSGFESRVRKIPGYSAWSRSIPKGMRTTVRDRLRRRIDPNHAVISREFRVDLENELRADVKRLYEYMGPDFDGWGIA